MQIWVNYSAMTSNVNVQDVLFHLKLRLGDEVKGEDNGRYPIVYKRLHKYLYRPDMHLKQRVEGGVVFRRPSFFLKAAFGAGLPANGRVGGISFGPTSTFQYHQNLIL